jgi:hypothetical protein
MSNGPNGQSVSVMLFSAAVMIALLAVTLMTFQRGYPRTASYESPPGATVLAKAGPPQDRAEASR